ncbi:Arc family DNA-binding protein [Undibacterium sp.]|uniref:Arc family DNA-binding protein n=1 Tax=Undibacterium sp. TaxID=1914977 RepID=UPI0037520511
MAKQDDYIKTALRLPRPIHEKLLVESESSGKSMNAEIIARLEKSFKEDPIDPTSLSGIQQQILGLVDENIKMRQLLTEHLEFIGVKLSPDEKN